MLMRAQTMQPPCVHAGWKCNCFVLCGIAMYASGPRLSSPASHLCIDQAPGLHHCGGVQCGTEQSMLQCPRRRCPPSGSGRCDVHSPAVPGSSCASPAWPGLVLVGVARGGAGVSAAAGAVVVARAVPREVAFRPGGTLLLIRLHARSAADHGPDLRA